MTNSVYLQMEAELSEFSRDNKALQLAMAQKDLRLDATTTEMLQERQKVDFLISSILSHQNLYTDIIAWSSWCIHAAPVSTSLPAM